MHNRGNIATAIKRIEEVRQQRLLHLDLSGLMLSELPVNISDLDFILEIDLSWNHFITIPSEITSLVNLQVLNVSNNYITYIDYPFGPNYAMREINISNNFLSMVPESLSFFGDSVMIYFENNPFLKGVPFEMEYQDFEYVKYYLELIKDEKEVHRFYETKLIFVGAGEVGKTTLMKVLKNPSHAVQVGGELTTHGINIDSLNFDVFFPAYPPYYNTFHDIENVYLPEEKNEEDNDEEFEDYQIDTTYKPFANILSDYDDEDTASIMMTTNLAAEFEGAVIERQVATNCWDFGGQEIYYSTHQFFLTKRSVYIFVWEPRKDDNEEDFEYWLNAIKLLSVDSPVIVVMNKSDIRHKNIDQRAYQEKFKNIHTFISVSCLTKEGIFELSTEIKNCIRNLRHIGDKIPKSWIKVRAKIGEEKKDFISFREFSSLCNESKLISENREVNMFSEYLHDVGDIIHFKDDSVLRNLVIINPQWATKAVYKLIDTIEIQRNNGVFNFFELERYWDVNIYPIEKHLELLQLMEKFEICFKLIGASDTYVIPELLKTEMPDFTVTKEIESDEPLRFQIYYHFMPHGVLTRLICRLYNIILKDNYWKNGVIFQSETSKALVISDRAKKTITLSISGKQKSNLLGIIRHELSAIHSHFNMKEKDDYTEKLPCDCNECKISSDPYYFSFDVLKNFLQKDKDFIDCHKSAESVNIQGLVSGYKLIKPERKIIYEILSAASQLQGKNKMIVATENARNSFITTLLSSKGIIAKDQSQWGSSETGILPGSLDIKIEDNEGNILSIYEGLCLSSLNSGNLEKHILKAISNYDPNGLREKYLGVYYEGSNFNAFCNKYFHFINDEDHPFRSFISVQDETSNLVNHSEINVFKAIYSRNDKPHYLYHILINLPKASL